MKRHKLGVREKLTRVRNKPHDRSTQVPAIIAPDAPVKPGKAALDVTGTIVGYDYATLPPDVAKFARRAAENIKSTPNENLIEIGQNLLAVKQKLRHGQFGAWIRAEFRMAERTAQRYMAAARLAAENDTVSDLPPTALYALASPTTPDAARKNALKRLVAGKNCSVREINALIREAKVAGVDRPKNAAVMRKAKVAKHPSQSPSNPPVRFTTTTGPLIRNRLKPADQGTFWARIRDKGDYLLVCDVSADKK